MKHTIVTLICCLAISYSFAQEKASELFKKMENSYDQFNDLFDPSTVGDKLTIFYIPGNNDPFSKIYDKHKGKKLTENVQFIGGFGEMMKGWDIKTKKGHLQDAFKSRYGKTHFTILLDLNSEVATLFSIKGYAIIQVSKKENRVIEVQDYGFDRIAFFKDLKKYITNP